MESQALEQINQQNIEENAKKSGKKSDKKKGRKNKKPMSGAAGFFLGILFMLLLLLLFGVFVFFNLFGVKTMTIDFIAQGVSPYTEIEAKIIEDQVAIRAENEKLDQRAAELDARAAEIAAQEDAARNLMSQARQALDDAQFYRDQLNDTSVNVSRIADWLGRMSPERAGTILAAMRDGKYMIRVLTPMDDKKAAKILESVDPDLSAMLMNEMGRTKD